MPTSLGQTQFDAMLHELYPDGEPENVAWRKRPTLKLIPKFDDFEGDQMVVPIETEYPVGRSATFANTLANAAPTRSKKWVGTQRSDYQAAFVDALTMFASRSKRGAFVNAVKREIDGALKSLGCSASISLFRDGNGAIGTIATINANDIILTQFSDAGNFAIGQIVTFAALSTGAALRDAGDFLTVSGVDRAAGRVTFSTATSNIVGLTVGDSIFTQGDENNKKIQGFDGWLPLTAPAIGGGDNWMGVDRSEDQTRLAGWRLNAAANGVQENIIQLCELVSMDGGEPDYFVLNNTKYTDLVKEVGSKVEYDDSEDAAVGKRAIRIYHSGGVVKVLADPDCPANRGYALTLDTWELHHLEAFPHIVMDDGLKMVRRGSADGIEIRTRYWANLFCKAPGRNGVCAL